MLFHDLWQIIEWPDQVKPRVTNFPACTMDLFPTVADLLSLPGDIFVKPLDGISLRPLLSEELVQRDRPIPRSGEGRVHNYAFEPVFTWGF